MLAHLVRTGGYARGLPAVKLLEMTDAISMSMERVARADLGYFDFRRLVYSIEARRLAAYERRITADFELVSLNSAVDRSFLLASPRECGQHVIVVPNGADAPRETPPPLAGRPPAEIVFIGNLQSLQNFDAAWFFARHVLPRVRDRRPEAVFRVIGPIPGNAERRLGVLPGVRIEGFVPSLEAALATARIGVCASRIASGMQNKVLDYLSHRLAVVCSPVALEGLDARDGEHLLVADTLDEWTERVIRLIDDEALAQRLADAGRLLACFRYRWDRCTQPLLSRLDELLAAREAPHDQVPLTPSESSHAWTAQPAVTSRSSGT